MNTLPDASLPEPALSFLKHCYRFVTRDWQHASREQLPDQGFERKFRESCVLSFADWIISYEREMHLGCDLDTLSGVNHEVDIVAQREGLMAILELKNRQGLLVNKADVTVFFAKILDYLALNSVLLQREICPIFMSTLAPEDSGLAACLGLGIHPVAPELRPLPILINSARIMDRELEGTAEVAPDLVMKFQDFCAQLNRVSLALSETWLTSRCGYLSPTTISIRGLGGISTISLVQEYRQLNTACSQLINDMRRAKTEVST